MIVVTGGAGFIGSVLVWELNRHGIEDIMIVDTLGTGEKWQNIVKRKFVKYVHKERFLDEIRNGTLPKVEAIVHLGACSSTTEKNCDYLYQNNVEYTQALCQYGLEKGIRVIVASSAATYGDGSHGFSIDNNDLEILRPLNMYGYTKHLVDLWLVRTNALANIAALKFFNVYGPNEYHKQIMASVVFKAFEQIEDHGSLALFASRDPSIKDGEQSRDFVYVKDCCALIYWLLEHKDVCGIFNVGSGQARTFLDLGRAVFAALKRKEEINFIPMPEILHGKYQNYTCADMSWLARYGCPVVFRSIEEGVFDYIQHYLLAQDRYL